LEFCNTSRRKIAQQHIGLTDEILQLAHVTDRVEFERDASLVCVQVEIATALFGMWHVAREWAGTSTSIASGGLDFQHFGA